MGIGNIDEIVSKSLKVSKVGTEMPFDDSRPEKIAEYNRIEIERELHRTTGETGSNGETNNTFAY